MNIVQKFSSKAPSQKINNACLNAIKETEADLGTVDTIDLLSNALPLIIERQKMIELALQEADADSAGFYAHKTLGSVRLYGTEQLENYLNQLKHDQVADQDIDSFKTRLSNEFDAVIFTIGEWLALNEEAC